MGFFNKMIGSVDESVIKNGILARGEITKIDITGVTVRVNNKLAERKCTISMYVMMDGAAPYQVTVMQKFPEIMIPQMNSVVPVRVDPNDHNKVFIDMKSELPTITLPRSNAENSASYILQNGKPIKVVLTASQPQKMKNADGHDVHLLSLTVYEGVDTPYQTQVPSGVPVSALPLMYPGSKLHARLGAEPNYIAIDWAAGAVT